MNTNSHIWHALCVGIAIVTAIAISKYITFNQQGWLVLSAFLCTQTTRGTPLRQGVIFCFTMVLAVTFATVLALTQLTVLTKIVVASVFVISAYLVYAFRPLSNKDIFHAMLFSFVLTIATLIAENNHALISDRLLAIGLGGVIGIILNQFFFSLRLDKSFFYGVTPLLKSLRLYSESLTRNLLGKSAAELLVEHKLNVEKSMLPQYSVYPGWVFETGFNPGLRASWRYFLINLERVTELYFALEFFAQRHTDLTPIAENVVTTMRKNEELLLILLNYVESQQKEKVESDFTSDLEALEDALRRVVPDQLELLDISPDYVALTAIVKNIRDLRGILLKLVMTLPA